MINKNKLKAIIMENGLSIPQVAKILNISKATFYARLNSDGFNTKDIDTMIKLFKINDKERFVEIFFTNFVA
ncbi:helix-turn-helix domain-containing protein [Streptobacillus canis]|uniref:XRE family transcriptional regulator n=1 Tax=Streptobacillus canis TaxID=2678686 RepID=UPI0012E104EF|nr:XRE family transcriptional regulator [Streptobacillus canis]